MIVLITNDDGIYSEGIKLLAKKFSSFGKVFVIAPDRERSAISHAITFHHPIRVEEVNFGENNIKAWSANGTPADCVKLALDILLPQKPDIIISGINRGANLGNDIFYSGTVSAALEGTLSGIPSIAVSLSIKNNTKDYELDYTNAVNFTQKTALKVLESGVPSTTALNINVPNTNSINGTAVTKLGRVQYKNCFVKRIDPRGKIYYWLSGDIIEETQDNDTDVWAVRNNYISITPITLNLTNYEFIEVMKNWDF
ncbi:MAG TPA: 5'/3'-nucleotidase SurE [Thermoanaerobacterales bacterium]|nr:5'/3'-nucleotidase SurE [Thermoanaerobacterales bacterium]